MDILLNRIQFIILLSWGPPHEPTTFHCVDRFPPHSANVTDIPIHTIVNIKGIRSQL